MAGDDEFNGGNGDGWDQVDYEAEEEIGSILQYPTGMSQYGIFVNQSDDNGVDVANYLSGQDLTDFLGGRLGPVVADAYETIDTFGAKDTLNGIEEVKGHQPR